MSSTITALTSGGGLAMAGDTSGQLQLLTNNGTAAVTIDTSQNVGIGTSTPAAKLDVSSSGATVASVSTTGASPGVVLKLLGTTATYKNWAIGSTYAAINGGLEFIPSTTNGGSTFTTPSMVLDSGGNLFLGGTSTTYGSKFTIYSSGGGNIIESKQTGSGSQYHVIYMNSNGAVGSIQTSGSNTSYVTSSDYRLKEDIAPMTGALAIVSALKPVTYKWKTDGSSGQGFIAHELQEIVPEAVAGAKDGVETVDDVDAEGKVIGTKEVPKYQGIDTSFLVATLTAAIQELNAKVDAQALEIQALKGVA